MNKKPKIAIIHDWLVTDGGAEKVLREFLYLFPDAEIFTIVDFLADDKRAAIVGNTKIHTSFIQRLPFAKKHFRNYLFLFPKAVESFDLSGFDIVLSSSWAFAKGVKCNPSQQHICYCYTPIRYAWDLYEEYIGSLPPVKKQLVASVLFFIRRWDKKTALHVNRFVAISHYIANRIERTYNRKSVVIYPPVDVESFRLHTEKQEFYVTASRLVAYKKTALIVKAFTKLPDKKLVVIGNGEEYDKLVKMAPKNVSMLGYLPHEKLVWYLQNAKGYIYAAIEDFGIAPIEAMACGTPVIALNKGATAETVTEGLNGIHFDSQTPESISEAVLRFEKTEFDPEVVSQSVQKYAVKRFHKEIKMYINTEMPDE